MNLSTLFRFCLPEKFRRERVPEKEFNATLARLSDNDPCYRAMLDLLHAQFEQEMIGCLNNQLTPEQRTFQCGRAAHAYALLQAIEAARLDAKTELELDAKKK